MKRGLKKWLRFLRGDLYFSSGRGAWTDEPLDDVVRLRDSIVDLIEGRVSEINGVTDAEECYVLAGLPTDKQYTLAHVHKEKIIKYTSFACGWPPSRQNESAPAPIAPQPFVIRGNPYKITKGDAHPTQVMLKIENQGARGS